MTFLNILVLLLGLFTATTAYAAVFNVNTVSDGNDANVGDGWCDADLSTSGLQCTLRAAVEEANVQPDQDQIVLTVTGIYDLERPDPSLASLDTALRIQGSLTVDGQDADVATISAGNRGYRVFAILPGSVVIIRRVTISDGIATQDTGGTGWGGGIQNAGNLTLDDVTLSNNAAKFGGAVAAMSGAITSIANSRIRGNRATSELEGELLGLGGGFSIFSGMATIRDTLIEGNTASYAGGGVYNHGLMDIERTTISRNIVTRPDCDASSNTVGGGVLNKSRLEITNSQVIENEATCGGKGCGIANIRHLVSGDSSVLAENVIIRRNKARLGGGLFNSDHLEIKQSQIHENSSDFRGGGGLHITGDDSDTVVGNSRISNNAGPAVHNEGNLDMLRVAIDNNVGQNTSIGAALTNKFSGRMMLRESSIFGNSFQSGRSPFILYTIVNEGRLVLENVTIAFNSGGLENRQWGRAHLTNVTITGNTGNQLAHGARADTSGETRIKNTIIAKPLANGFDCAISNTYRSTFISDGFNLGDDETCGFSEVGDLNNVEAKLTGRMFYGTVPTIYYGLQPDSPAIDAVPTDECVGIDGMRISIDQREVSRPQGPACDMGAYEH